jgi:hypothetical protein
MTVGDMRRLFQVSIHDEDHTEALQVDSTGPSIVGLAVAHLERIQPVSLTTNVVNTSQNSLPSRAKERLRNSLNALNGLNGGFDSLCAGRWLISYLFVIANR